MFWTQLIILAFAKTISIFYLDIEKINL